MKNITTFTPNNLELIRNEIESKLAELKELGLHISLGNMSYSPITFTAKISCQLVSDGEEAKSEYEINWEKGGYFKHGLNKDDLGKTINLRGEDHTIVGCKVRRGKNGIIIKSKSGGLYNFNSTEAARLLKLNK